MPGGVKRSGNDRIHLQPHGDGLQILAVNFRSVDQAQFAQHRIALRPAGDLDALDLPHHLLVDLIHQMGAQLRIVALRIGELKHGDAFELAARKLAPELGG